MRLGYYPTSMEIDNYWNNGAINWHIEFLYLAHLCIEVLYLAHSCIEKNGYINKLSISK